MPHDKDIPVIWYKNKTFKMGEEEHKCIRAKIKKTIS